MKDYLVCLLAVVIVFVSIVAAAAFFIGGILLICGIHVPVWIVITGGIIVMSEAAYLLQEDIV